MIFYFVDGFYVRSGMSTSFKLVVDIFLKKNGYRVVHRVDEVIEEE